MASVQELVTVGEKMGLKGEGLQAFVREQQTLAKEAATEKLDREREERAREREFVKEKKLLALEKEKLRVNLELKKLEVGMLDGSEKDAASEGDNEIDNASACGSDRGKRRFKARTLKLSLYEERDDVDAFLFRLEKKA